MCCSFKVSTRSFGALLYFYYSYDTAVRDMEPRCCDFDMYTQEKDGWQGRTSSK
jgi:hypothetical protein